LKDKFWDQPAVLRYIQKIWMPLRYQWARCYIKGYRNFGARVTLPTELINLNAKTYLLNGKADTFRLVDALQVMAERQVDLFE